MPSNHLAILVIPLACFLTGCYTSIQAPGAVGKVVDARTGTPLERARITRIRISGRLEGTTGMTPELEIPDTTWSDKRGSFNLPPILQEKLKFMYLQPPKEIPGSFLVRREGYATQELAGVATRRSRWRVDLGQVPLRRSDE
jgi:hypothetical protein